jgi:ABC-type uncharacterized transport system permease subunit
MDADRRLGCGAAVRLSDALQVAISLRPPEGQLGDLLGAIPPEAYHSLPYLLTIIILAGVVGRSVPPAADGRPFAREAHA